MKEVISSKLSSLHQSLVSLQARGKRVFDFRVSRPFRVFFLVRLLVFDLKLTFFSHSDSNIHSHTHTLCPNSTAKSSIKGCISLPYLEQDFECFVEGC